MALHYDYSKVKPYEGMWVKRVEHGEEDEYMNAILETLIWQTIGIGLWNITEDNVDEWEWRFEFMTRMGEGGLISYVPEGETECKTRMPTRAEIAQNVGLFTNTSSMKQTRKQFIKKRSAEIEKDTDRAITARRKKEV